MTNNTITIEAGDIVDFTFKIQQAILDGYRLSDQGDFAPQCIGFVYVTTMEKVELGPIDELSLVLSVDTEQAIKDFQTIADAAVKYNIDDETISPDDLEKYVSVESNVEEKVNEGVITVEHSIVPPKQTQRRNTRK